MIDSQARRRRSIRLLGYDYAQAGWYFVTICTWGKLCVLGQVGDGVMRLNEIGGVVQEEWLRTAAIRQEVELDVFQIMPNHIHGIVAITRSADQPVGAHGRAPLRRAPKSLGALVAGFKSAATKTINQLRATPGNPVWQRNYYEHVIRNEKALNRIRQYILDNPAKWDEDPENPDVLRSNAHGQV